MPQERLSAERDRFRNEGVSDAVSMLELVLLVLVLLELVLVLVFEALLPTVEKDASAVVVAASRRFLWLPVLLTFEGIPWWVFEIV